MSSNGIIIHSNQISRAGLKQQIIKNGSSVLVRIIEDKGNGKYTGSVAGVRVNLSSNKSYSVGSSFIAKVNVVDGKIFVTPDEKTAENQQMVRLTVLQDSQLMEMMKNLGLPADSLSLKLLQQLKQMEMKYDSGLLKKIHSMALKFNGKEKAAAELLLMLAEKNISIDSEEIQNILSLLYDESSENKEERENGKKAINRFNKTEGAWYFYPFEMIDLENNNKIGEGIIRTLFSKNNLKLLNIDCKYSGRRFLFNLNIEFGKCRSIKFNISDLNVENIEHKVLDLKRRLSDINVPVNIEWVESNEIEGTASDSENIYSFAGKV